MLINNFFDKIYCINLDHRFDRWKESVEEFKKHKIITERFSAATGEHPMIPANKRVNSGEAGLITSHILIFADAIKNGYKNFLILEDDVEFDSNFNKKFEENIKDLPEQWDILYLGGNNIMPPLNYKNNIYLSSKTYTTHAIGVNSKSIKKIFDRIDYNYPIDVNYSMQTMDSNTYAFIMQPNLAWQRVSYSDINKNVVNYDFLRN